MINEKSAEHYDLFITMFTDILKANSKLLFVDTDRYAMSRIFGKTVVQNELFLERVVSRKKQIIPLLTKKI